MKKDIIFISGWGTNEKIWKALKNNLGGGFNYLYLPWNDYINNHSCAESVLSGNTAIIISWSLGALIALKITLYCAVKISKLILVSPTARMTKDMSYEGVSPKILKIMRSRLKTSSSDVIEKFAKNCFFDDDNRNFINIFRQQASEYSVSDLYKGLEFLQDTDLRNNIQKLNIPIFIIHGTKDKIIPVSQGEFLNKNLISSRLKLVESGHGLPISCMSDISKEIEDFICM